MSDKREFPKENILFATGETVPVEIIGRYGNWLAYRLDGMCSVIYEPTGYTVIPAPIVAFEQYEDAAAWAGILHMLQEKHSDIGSQIFASKALQCWEVFLLSASGNHAWNRDGDKVEIVVNRIPFPPENYRKN